MSQLHRELRDSTTARVTEAVDRARLEFFRGPARYLMNDHSDKTADETTRKIFALASKINQQIWIERTNISCTTLRNNRHDVRVFRVALRWLFINMLGADYLGGILAGSKLKS